MKLLRDALELSVPIGAVALGCFIPVAAVLTLWFGVVWIWRNA